MLGIRSRVRVKAVRRKGKESDPARTIGAGGMGGIPIRAPYTGEEEWRSGHKGGSPVNRADSLCGGGLVGFYTLPKIGAVAL